MHLKDVMNQPVVVCRHDDSLDSAARLMWEFDCGIVPVVDHEGRLVGVVTDRDICMSAYTQGQPLSAIPVTTAMAKHVVAAHVDDSVEAVEALMSDNQIRRLPVIAQDGCPIGVVSLNDLVRHATQARRGGAAERELVQTLAAIGRSRMKQAEPESVRSLSRAAS